MTGPDIRGLLGVFLADGYLARSRGPVGGHVKATLLGGPHEQDFLGEKVAAIQAVVPTTAQVTTYRMPPSATGHRTTVLRFRFCSPLLDPVYNLLYPEGEREVTRPVLDVLGHQAAAWLWAEGFKEGNGSPYLRRVGALEEEARLISGWLEVLTGASSTVSGGPGSGGSAAAKPWLRFSPDAAARAKEALLPYAPASRRHLFEPGRP